MEDAGYDTQTIDLRSLVEADTFGDSEREQPPENHAARTSGRRLSAHFRLLIGVMALATLAVLGTRLAGALLAAGPVG